MNKKNLILIENNRVSEGVWVGEEYSALKLGNLPNTLTTENYHQYNHNNN
jgi:hypothetical protein